jgi:CheY-like chemotaxis protein
MQSAKSVVLVVDDELPLLDLLQEAFAEEGFRVLTARNGHEALGILVAQRVDIVVSDIRMPGMNGLELRQRAQELKEHDPPIWIALTAHVDGDGSAVVNLDSFNESFFKPYSPWVLARLCKKFSREASPHA